MKMPFRTRRHGDTRRRTQATTSTALTQHTSWQCSRRSPTDRPVSPESIYCEGIGNLAPRDFRYAHDLGYAIKLLAIAKDIDGGELDVRVHPAFIASDAQLAKVDGVYNAVQFDSDSAGELLLYGRGAGSGQQQAPFSATSLKWHED